MSEEKINLNLKKLYTGSSMNVFKSVILGKSDAGVTLDIDIEKAPKDVTAQLRPIYTTEKMAPHPISAHPRIPVKVREAMARGVLGMARDAAGKAVLSSVGLSGPVRAEYGRDYRSFEEVEKDPLVRGK